MSETVAVILAAGQSRRFVEAGYTTPKPFLRIKAKSGHEAIMLDFVIQTLPVGISTFVAVPAELPPLKHTSSAVKFMNIAKTRGQADTAYQVLRHIPVNRQVIILDCDMVLRYQDVRDIIALLSLFETVTAVTNTFDPNASRVDQVPFPTRWVEKEPISSWGIIGARAYRSAGRLTNALELTLAEEKGEPYLSTAMNHYETFGQNYAHEITQFEDWGTPERITASGAKIL